MPLFRRSSPPAVPARTAHALVIEADTPPQNPTMFGDGAFGVVRAFVYDNAGPREMTARFRHNDRRWLVRGMDMRVFVDPAHPDWFEVDWDAIAGMEQRVAANDPVLADPIAAAHRVAQAMGVDLPQPDAQRQDAFKTRMERATAAPAPPGWMWAVALVTSIRGRLHVTGSDAITHIETRYHQNSEAVLAVNIPGRPPYALFLPKFRFPQGKGDYTGSGLPALVSATDPRHVEIQWDELTSTQTQLADRIASDSAAAVAQLDAVQEQFMQAAYRANGNGGPQAGPS